METVQLIDLFLQSQGERASTYNFFHDSFKEYLELKDEPKYTTSCEHITKKFSTISQQINQLMQSFQENDRSDIAALLRQIQDLEKTKLAVTVQQQLTRKALLIDYNSDEDEPEQKSLLENKLINLTKQANSVVEQIVELTEEIKSIKYDLTDVNG
mmetsp:Transcript_20364/g.28547  ORF Transcript_20364/g.28547 Transcript_20364/m.28547 type:complete len:156 (+) Transcript_20364:1030-1497(+)